MKQFKRDEKQNSNKLNLDQYYTPDNVAQHCIDVARKILKDEKVTEVIEPSAGNGSFSKKLKKCIAYDIDPKDDSIIQQDFLSLDIPYKKGRLIIGNPPFGRGNVLSIKFIRKSLEIGDYVAFIQPISQYENKNNFQLSNCDLIYSEKLGKIKFSDREINSCFNVYVRNNKKDYVSKYKSKLLKIKESRPSRNQFVNNFEYDIAICGWGYAIGKEIIEKESYAKEFYIKILDEKQKNKILNVLKNVDWKTEYPMTSTPNLNQWQIHEYVENQIFKSREDE